MKKVRFLQLFYIFLIGTYAFPISNLRNVSFGRLDIPKRIDYVFDRFPLLLKYLAFFVFRPFLRRIFFGANTKFSKSHTSPRRSRFRCNKSHPFHRIGLLSFGFCFHNRNYRSHLLHSRISIYLFIILLTGRLCPR